MLRLLGFRPPSTLAMEQLEDSLSGFNYSSFISKFKQNGGVWLTFSLKDYVSYDGSHLHYESANKFSKNLGLKIENTLSSYPRTSCTESATALITVSICSLVKLNQTGSVISL